MGKAGKNRQRMFQHGETEGRKKKDEGRKGTKERRTKKIKRNEKINNALVSTRLLRKFPDLMVPILAIALIGRNKQKHLSMNTKEEYTEKNCYSTVVPVYPRPSMHYLKELQTSISRTQFYATTLTSELFHNAPMPTNSYTRSQMKLYKHTTQDTRCTPISPTLNWK